MDFIKTKISEIVLIKPKVILDQRGYFVETFLQEEFDKAIGHKINFFQENDIAIEKSNMSFSVSVRNSNIEYCGKGLSGIFSNKSNLLNIKFLKMFFN